MNNSAVSLLWVGIGGYGEVLLNEIFRSGDAHGVTIAAAVEPYPDACRMTGVLKEKGIPLYADMEDAFAAGISADIAVLVTPIAYHTRHILTALAHGMNVVCEKPLCGDARDIDTISVAQDKAGKFVYIGYQWSHSAPIEALKRDIFSGAFGKPLSLKTLVLWPRNAAYFKRGTGWAGKLKASDGTLIYDSIANNAAAHYLHNMFYVLGDSLTAAAAPVSFDAKLMRANQIENFDTAHIVCRFENGATADFIASHAIGTNLNPLFLYRFEKGDVYFSQDEVIPAITDADKYEAGCIKAYMADGSVRRYGNPFDGLCDKIYIAAATVRGDANGYARCTIETAAVHTRFINALQENAVIGTFGVGVKTTDDGLTYVEGLYERLIALYNEK